MEATRIGGVALAEFMYEASHIVSVVNPARIKGFARGELLRTKTDKVDAALIARFCAAIKPPAWVPLPPEVKQLQALLRRLESTGGDAATGKKSPRYFNRRDRTID